MGKTIVQKRIATNQAVFSKDGKMGTFESFIDDIIREYGKPTGNDYVLSAYDLDPKILRLFIHYIVDEDDLDDLSKNPSLYDAYIKDNIDVIQRRIDSRTFEVYKSDMYEMGYHLCHHKDNGEPYYSGY